MRERGWEGEGREGWRERDIGSEGERERETETGVWRERHTHRQTDRQTEQLRINKSV